MNYSSNVLDPYLRKQTDYEFIKRINQGGFGIVDLVKKVGTEELYAKKSIPFDDDDECAQKYFVRELLALYLFRFKGLPFLYFEGFNFPSKFKGKKIDAYFITNYISGGSLSDLIKKKFKNCDDIPTSKMIIIYGICFALEIMHKSEIVHRDLKPDNILINDNLEPILADFGFARLIKKEDIFITRNIGTLVYMAPEIITNEEEEDDDDEETDDNIDFSIDVYSFGVLLLEIIYGKLTFNKGKDPFNVRNENAFISHIKSGKGFDLPESDVLPDNFKNIITRCCDIDPQKRLTMKEINEEMQNGELDLPGCNTEKLHEYIDRLSEIYHQYEQKNQKKANEEKPDTEEFDFMGQNS